MIVAAVVIIVFLAIALAFSIKIASEHERVVIFRLGRLLPDLRGPGLFLVVPIIEIGRAHV